MKILNNKGPKTEPWGTPLLTYEISLVMSSSRTRCLRFFKELFGLNYW